MPRSRSSAAAHSDHSSTSRARSPSDRASRPANSRISAFTTAAERAGALGGGEAGMTQGYVAAVTTVYPRRQDGICLVGRGRLCDERALALDRVHQAPLPQLPNSAPSRQPRNPVLLGQPGLGRDWPVHNQRPSLDHARDDVGELHVDGPARLMVNEVLRIGITHMINVDMR